MFNDGNRYAEVVIGVILLELVKHSRHHLISSPDTVMSDSRFRTAHGGNTRLTRLTAFLLKQFPQIKIHFNYLLIVLIDSICFLSYRHDAITRHGVCYG